MNTTLKQKKPLIIKAQHIGPVMQLDQPLSDGKQNLIFARNGSGKSFIARALRHLDGAANTSVGDSDVPNFLVSEESGSGTGFFKLYEGEDEIGGLELCTKTPSVTRSPPKYIFHVFSEDYVDDEVRNKLEKLDGEITHEIIIGKENADLDAFRTTIESKQKDLSAHVDAISTEFSAAKDKLKTDFGIIGSLGAYKALNVNCYFGVSAYLPDPSVSSLDDLLKSYNRFKTLPSDPSMPATVDFDFTMNTESVASELEKITSLSTVEESFKSRVSADETFFELGLKMLESEEDHCPFCTQDLNTIGSTAIAAYRAYFEDEEAQHRRRIKVLLQSIEAQSRAIASAKQLSQTSKIDFDDLKSYFPTMADKDVTGVDDELDRLSEFLSTLKSTLEKKSNQLGVAVLMPGFDHASAVKNVQQACAGNATLFNSLSLLVNDSTGERKALQSSSCAALTHTFAVENAPETTALRALAEEVKTLQSDYEIMKKDHGDKAPARERVADTFSKLMKRFFQDKYSFDKTDFKVRRNNKEMIRGGDRTLSDGEKSAMAFCYFIAQTHLRVESNDDYTKLYFVFDDPVTSMSFDYVYTIIMCLKLLRIASDGEIGFNLESTWHKPKMLILTHNNYFYNVASTNNIVNAKGLYQLVSGTSEHVLRSQESFATPHALQLQDVFLVSEGKKPDHTTANSIRSVIESIGKFVQPDKKQFGDFIKLFADDHGIEIRSALINDLCHGGKIEDTPHIEDDLIMAAKEAIEVVKRYAPGQLSRLQS
jgi:hypothetical protein